MQYHRDIAGIAHSAEPDDRKTLNDFTYPSSARIVHMTKTRYVRAIAGETTLQLVSVRIGNSFGHGERQAGSSKDMAAVDRSNDRINKVQKVGSVLGIDEMEAVNRYREQSKRGQA